ncbi:F-box/kelch-repeat protein [Canna indica]|uniref:F-box/kelch-repeat protein n=1 Tax=Canna indica TaxID=4628 RepID=A0AAQ3JUK5_9LILI|nr:F-box/kelch-repeat protein [Canna indica]
MNTLQDLQKQSSLFPTFHELLTHQEPHERGGKQELMEGAPVDEDEASADHITIGDLLADEAFGKIAHALAVGMNAPSPPLLQKSTPFASNEKSRKKRAQAIWNGYLPVEIVELVLARMNPKDAVRLSTACKDWRATAARYDPTLKKTPWLLTMMLSKTNCRMRSVVDKEVSFKIKLHGFEPQRTSCCGCSQGWLVLRRKRNDPFSLFNPFSRARFDLPSPKPASTTFLYLSSAPTIPGCVLLARNFKNLFVWRPGDVCWTAEEVDLGKFDAVARFQGQFYALHSSNGSLISFQLFPFKLRKLHVPPPMDINKTLHYLVESCDEVLLVCIVVPRWNRKFFVVHVYRLDAENKAWIEIKSLGDRALFLNRNQAISVSARDSECGVGCIYFTTPASWHWCNWSGAWHVYNMDNKNMESVPKKVLQHRMFGDNVWITPCLN